MLIAAPERERIANSLAKQLPSGFRFDALRQHEMGGFSNNVAFFLDGDGQTFALIPGGEVRIGYDANRPWEPNPDELASWNESAEEWGFAESINDYIASVTLRPQSVTLRPFLVETVSKEVGWTPLDLDDPDVKSLVRDLPRQQGNYESSLHQGDRVIRVRRDTKGNLTAELAQNPTWDSLSTDIATSGFRFPTSAEWEYACGAGADTLFRWGDHVPCDRYPTDLSPEEAEWRRDWVLSQGELERPKEDFQWDWDHHKRANAFGIAVAHDPYKLELVAERNITRGGDGGCMICGGAGFFVGWLPLATSYFDKQSCEVDPEYGIPVGYAVARRVLPLD